MSNQLAALAGEGYAQINLGPLADLTQYERTFPNGMTGTKVFLKALLGTTGSELSIGVMPPGFILPFTHRHHDNEELYIFLSGAGEIQLDESIVPFNEGTIIRVDPPLWRGLRNTGTVPVVYMVVQTKKDSIGAVTGEDSDYGEGPSIWLRAAV
ncbi:MAG: cupin domain-containing protein [bacterium]